MSCHRVYQVGTVEVIPCHGLNCVPPKFIRILFQNVAVFGNRTCKEVIKLK